MPIDELPAAERNSACPVKLLLILTLGAGVVEERSWDKLLEDCQARKSRSVLWTRPNDSMLPPVVGLNLYTLNEPSNGLLLQNLQRVT